MRLFHILTALLLGLGLVSIPAYAKKDKGDTEYVKIEKTGIQEIDKIFSQVGQIQDTLGAVEESINSTTTSLNTALGLAEDTPFTTAIEDLKSKAEGAIQVTLDGGNPQLTTSDAVPANVQAGIDAVNLGVAEINSAIAGLKELPAQLSELQKQATSFDPGKVKDQASKAGLGLTETLAAVKVVGNNLKATSQTVDRAARVKDASIEFMSAFTGTFGEATSSSGAGGSTAGSDKTGTRSRGGDNKAGSDNKGSGNKGSGNKGSGSGRTRTRGGSTGPTTGR